MAGNPAPLQARSPWGILPQPGGGWAPVGSPVFKTGGGSFGGPRWVRLPSTPAFRFLRVEWRSLRSECLGGGSQPSGATAPRRAPGHGCTRNDLRRFDRSIQGPFPRPAADPFRAGLRTAGPGFCPREAGPAAQAGWRDAGRRGGHGPAPEQPLPSLVELDLLRPDRAQRAVRGAAVWGWLSQPGSPAQHAGNLAASLAAGSALWGQPAGDPGGA